MTSDAAPTPAPTAAATQTGQIAAYELRIGDLLVGRFRIEQVLGIGGMGVVYRARDLQLDVDVALKVLRPELAKRADSFDRFRHELLLARQVSSPHVVRIHDLAEHDGRWFISMDYVAGQSLEQRLGSVGKLPVDEALEITRGLLDGLVAAHERGVIHRDLKPANLLIDASGRVFITDFGVARSLGATGLTQTGMIVGTPEYLSPEQARSEPVDARSDLYAVGLILHEMLTGALPFAGGTPAETVMRRIVRSPPSLAAARPDLPGWLHALCDRLLKLSPSHRFQSAREALRALENRHVPRAPLNRPLLLASMLGLLALVALGYWLPRLQSAAPTAAALAIATPRAALLPIQAIDDDAESAAFARALEAQLHGWLRSDAALAVPTRSRVLEALARTTVMLDAESLARRMPDVARSIAADRVIHGQLQRDTDGLKLRLQLYQPPGWGVTQTLDVVGSDLRTLYGNYLAAAPQWLGHATSTLEAAPPLAADKVLPLGRVLLALDAPTADVAGADVAQLTSNEPSALIEMTRLSAQDAAGEDLPAQETRDAAQRNFAKPDSPLASELHARALVGSGLDDEALKALAAATARWPHDPTLRLLEAEQRTIAGDNASALSLLRDQVSSDAQDARAWFLLGRASIQNAEAQAAVDDYLLRALVLYTRSGNRVAEAETRNALGVGYERLGQLEASAEQYQRAASMREALGDERGLAKSLRNLAIVQAVRGERDAAEATMQRVAELLERLGDRASLAGLYNDRGVVAEEQGDFAAALQFYRQALSLRRELELDDLIAESLGNVGFVSYQIGDYDNALVYWEQALTLYRDSGDRVGSLQIEQHMSMLDIARGAFASAGRRLQTSLRTSQDNQLPEGEAVAYTYLGALALLEGRLADAEQAVTAADRIFTRRSDQRGRQEAALLKARVALSQGDTVAADAALALISIADAGVEQTAAYELAKARVFAYSDSAKAGLHLNAAEQAARAAHSGNLLTQIELERARLLLAGDKVADAGQLLGQLSAAGNRLADVPLKLQWFELAIAAALRSGDQARAAGLYRQTLPLLRDAGQYVDATLLHASGAAALQAQSAEARSATAAADAARTSLLAAATESQRSALARELERRSRLFGGPVHGA